MRVKGPLEKLKSGISGSAYIDSSAGKGELLLSTSSPTNDIKTFLSTGVRSPLLDVTSFAGKKVASQKPAKGGRA